MIAHVHHENINYLKASKGLKNWLVTVDHNTVPLEADATALPESVEVSVENLPVGSQILAKDLVLPAGSALAIDPEALIVNITAAPTAADVEADLEEAEADLGIEHDASDAEIAAEAEAASAEGDGEGEGEGEGQSREE